MFLFKIIFNQNIHTITCILDNSFINNLNIAKIKKKKKSLNFHEADPQIRIQIKMKRIKLSTFYIDNDDIFFSNFLLFAAFAY